MPRSLCSLAMTRGKICFVMTSGLQFMTFYDFVIDFGIRFCFFKVAFK
ncbi:hypothetical protein [Helicobacter fennelliae]|nr:hypothetical protein [Helicobacter fennelliae]